MNSGKKLGLTSETTTRMGTTTSSRGFTTLVTRMIVLFVMTARIGGRRCWTLIVLFEKASYHIGNAACGKCERHRILVSLAVKPLLLYWLLVMLEALLCQP